MTMRELSISTTHRALLNGLWCPWAITVGENDGVMVGCRATLRRPVLTPPRLRNIRTVTRLQHNVARASFVSLQRCEGSRGRGLGPQPPSHPPSLARSKKRRSERRPARRNRRVPLHPPPTVTGLQTPLLSSYHTHFERELHWSAPWLVHRHPPQGPCSACVKAREQRKNTRPAATVINKGHCSNSRDRTVRPRTMRPTIVVRTTAL